MTDPYARRGRGPALGLVLGSIALVALLAIGISANLSWGKSGDQPVSVLATASDPATAVLPKVNEPNSTLAQTAPVDTPMPADIRAWLEHLQRIEARRVDITADQIGDMLVFMTGLQSSKITDAISGILGEDDIIPTGPTASDRLTNKAEDTRAAWRLLVDEFRSMPPPPECVPIAASYDQTLGETSAMMVEIIAAVESAGDNPQAAIAALTRMQGTSSNRIDSLARDADRQVAEVCDRYRTRKWFSIASDVGGGAMGKIGGIGGLGF